jgi:NADPH:quinone reductase-like Zn-dependent oxidoreductase
VGIVDKLGSGVTTLKPGQRVADLTVWGAYTEYALLPAENLVPVPPGVDAEDAVALILSYTTAYQMLYRIAEIKAGQSILIHGASGAVGTALAQLGKVSGLTMYGTASAGKQDYVRSLGVIPIAYGFYSIADFREQHPDWFRQDLGSLFELLAEQNIQPQLWKTLPLAQAAAAHRAIENGEVSGKIVLRVSE